MGIEEPDSNQDLEHMGNRETTQKDGPKFLYNDTTKSNHVMTY